MNETPDPCGQCADGGSTYVARDRARDGRGILIGQPDRFYAGCQWCGRAGADKATRDEAVADWNKIAAK